MHRSYISLAVLIMLLIGCSKRPASDHHTPRAFYYWQTSLSNFDWNDSVFRALHVKKVYYRFFDVGWSSETKAPVPVSPINFNYAYSWEHDSSSVPVVFITNDVFKNRDQKGATKLAQQVHRKVMMQLSAMRNIPYQDFYKTSWWEQDPYQVKTADFAEQQRHDSVYAARLKIIKEIQFDCDWTKSTRDNYFAFLAESKRLFNGFQVTSTIRLYQYKYPKEAGVPPVSRGMLMCYNAGDIRDDQTENSIFNKKEVMSYLEGNDAYALPLDYALPVFQWALLFQQGKLKAILSATDLMQNYGQHLSSGDNKRFKVTEEFVYGYTDKSTLLRIGDEIRLESPDMTEVEEVATWLGEHKNNPDAILTLYHLNTYDLHQHSEAIETLFNSF